MRCSFFVDGARSLHADILAGMRWFRPMRIFLDWYHLHEKCKVELSLVLQGKDIRNAVLAELMPCSGWAKSMRPSRICGPYGPRRSNPGSLWTASSSTLNEIGSMSRVTLCAPNWACGIPVIEARKPMISA